MNYHLWFLGATMTATAFGIPNSSLLSSRPDNTPQTAISCQISGALPYTIPCDTTEKTKTVLKELISCESGGRENALNPNDKDNTPSYGLLQFKPSTLLWAIRTYNLRPNIEDDEVMNLMFSGQLQVDAFLAMYGDGKPESWWKSQFPACSKMHGYWQ